MAKSKFLKLFKERGFFHQCTDWDSLDELLLEGEQSGEGITAYIGFDCTANSLHVGNLMMIMVLRLFKACGHKPIILLGGATTRIGDPSFKDESRPVITDETIAENMAGIKKVFEQLDLKTVPIVNNDDWYTQFRMDLIDISAHFSVNRMLSFDSVKLRIEREGHLSLKEFLYMVMQAYDFVRLAKDKKDGGMNCRLQIGGSDQWGNIVNGVELNRRITVQEHNITVVDIRNNIVPKIIIDPMLRRPPKSQEDVLAIEKNNNLFGLTTPLITTSSGAKMGKSVSGAVWLSADKLSTYDYWQFWRNTEDADVFKFMRLFTDIDLAEIAKLEADVKNSSLNINDAKKILANEATIICHGADAARDAEETARKVFEQGGVGDDLPTIEISKAELESGIKITKILQDAGLAESGGAAKRLIEGGGVKVNDVKVGDVSQSINHADLNAEGIIKISASKKKHALVKVDLL